MAIKKNLDDPGALRQRRPPGSGWLRFDEDIPVYPVSQRQATGTDLVRVFKMTRTEAGALIWKWYGRYWL